MLNRKMKKYVFVSGPLMCENCSFKARTTDVQRGNSLHAWPKIHSHSQIFKYGQNIFCLLHRPTFSDIFYLCLHEVFCSPWLKASVGVTGGNKVVYVSRNLLSKLHICK